MDYLNKHSADEAVLHRLLARRVQQDAGSPFFSFGEDVFSVGVFEDMYLRLANGLRSIGIGEGTHVAVLMDNSPDYLCVWFALSRLGAVEVPINTAYQGDLLTHVLQTSGATACIADARYLDAIRTVQATLGRPMTMVVRGANGEPGDAVAFEDLSDHSDTALEDIALPDAIAGIIFTSGTTGPSKGVMLSHHYLCAYGLMYAEINGLRDDDVILNFLPFFHIGAKFLTIAALVCGGRMRLQPRLSISTFWDEVREHGVTNFVGVGGICNMLISRPEDAGDANTTIRTIYAVPDPAGIHDEIERRFGCQLTTVYGSTEVGLPLFRSVGAPYRPGSCGRPSPYYDVAIVDDQDNPVPVGVSGEIVVRPRRPLLIGSGYVGMPERTIKAWRNLWLHTGDRGHADAEGWYYFDDRASDYIRRRGENISSFEVELLAASHPAIAEAVAVATPSEVGEDEVWLLVIPRQGMSLGHEEILRHCYAAMPYFMVPRFIDIVDSVPRTSTAKVEKYKIRQAGPGAKTWDREAHGWRVTRHGLQSPPPLSEIKAALSF